MANKLFIYGTLANTEIQKEVLGRVIKGIPDVLRGYERSEIAIDGETYPLIIPSKAGKVDGLIIEVMNEELKKIDQYEADAYKREQVFLESGVSAWVYIKR